MNEEGNLVIHRLGGYPERSNFEYGFFCPACRCGHGFKVSGGEPTWEFNGDMVCPTIRPSVRVTVGHGGIRPDEICHSQVTDGMIHFYDDSTHEMRGQTVALTAW